MLIQFLSINAMHCTSLVILVIYMTPLAPVKAMIVLHFLIHHVVIAIMIIVVVNVVKEEDLNKRAKMFVLVHTMIQFIK